MTVDSTDRPPGGPPPGAPPRKTPWIRWVALGCGGALVLLAIFVAVMYFVVRQATAGPEETVQAFLAAAGEGDYAAAHEHFSAPLQEAQPLAEFSAAAAANPTFFQVEETTFSSRSVDGGGASLSGTLRLRAGTEVPASFRLVRENDEWKLIAYDIGS